MCSCGRLPGNSFEHQHFRFLYCSAQGVLLTNATTGASQLEIFEMSSLDIAPGDGRVLKVDFSPSGHDISVTVKGRMSNIRSVRII